MPSPQADRPRSREEYLADHPWLARGFAAGPRAVRRGHRSLAERRGRLTARAFFIIQCAVSAGVAWFIAAGLLHHDQPFFAPVAALITLGVSFGQRLRRAGEVVVGVAVGIFIGDVVVHVLGAGYWQLILVVAAAMAVATALDAGVLMTTQAGVQAAFVTMIVPEPGGALSRWTDAVIGGLVALAAATVTPAAPVRRPRQQASKAVLQVAGILRDTAQALRTRDYDLAVNALERARATEQLLDKLRDVADDGMAVVRSSPFRRGHLPAVQAIADLLDPLDRGVRTLRVLVRRAMIAVREDEAVPDSYIALVEQFAEDLDGMAASLQVRRLPEASRGPLLDLADSSRHGADDTASLSAEVIRAQVCSAALDLLPIAGMTYEDAVDELSRRDEQGTAETTPSTPPA